MISNVSMIWLLNLISCNLGCLVADNIICAQLVDILVSSEKDDIILVMQDRCLKVSEVTAQNSFVHHELLDHLVVLAGVEELQSLDKLMIGIGISLEGLHHWNTSFRC